MSFGLHLGHFHFSYICQSHGEMPTVSCWTLSITYCSVIYIYSLMLLRFINYFLFSFFFLILTSAPVNILISSSINLLTLAFVYNHSMVVWERSKFPIFQHFPSSGIFQFHSTFLHNWKSFVHLHYFCNFIYIYISMCVCVCVCVYLYFSVCQ